MLKSLKGWTKVGGTAKFYFQILNVVNLNGIFVCKPTFKESILQQFQDSNRPFTVVLSTLRRPLRFFFLLCLLMQVNGIIYKVLPSNDSQFEGSIVYSLLVFIFDQHRTLVPKIVVKFPSKNNRSSASTSLIRQTARPHCAAAGAFTIENTLIVK